MATWPLSGYVLVDGYSEKPPDNTLRTEMGTGPPKARRRSTAAPRPFKLRKYVTTSEIAILDTFYTDTLYDGALQFDWQHPRTLSACSFRFTEQPSYEALGGTSWIVSLSLELMP